MIKIIFVMLLFCQVSIASDFDYKSSENTGMGKQERLSSIESFLIDLKQKMSSFKQGIDKTFQKEFNRLEKKVDQFQKKTFVDWRKQVDQAIKELKEKKNKDKEASQEKLLSKIKELEKKIEALEKMQENTEKIILEQEKNKKKFKAQKVDLINSI